MIVKYQADPNHVYRKYKLCDNKYYVDCACERVDSNGEKLICSYRHKREDRHKAAIHKKIIHDCIWESAAERTKTMLDYFKRVEFKKNDLDLSEIGVKHRLAMLIGKKNISIDVAASDEFYDFMIFLIAYGATLSGEKDPITTALKGYRHYKEGAIRKAVLETAEALRTTTVEEFSGLPFTSVSIDEGAVYGEKNVNFNLEAPLSHLDPFTIGTISIPDVTAKGYVEVLLQGLTNINDCNIKIGSCVCDGNTAQKKAFSYQWPESIRFVKGESWIQDIIFVPCLCHRINNSYKMVVKHNEYIETIINTIRSIANDCKQRKAEIGLTCPTYISTRWLYDFDIMEFLIVNRQQVTDVIGELPPEIEDLANVLAILRTLIRIFEDPKTPFHKGFLYMERAIQNFQELVDINNPFAELFMQSFLDYTLYSEEAGLWIIAYILTTTGHIDFHTRLFQKQDIKVHDPLEINRHKEKTRPTDELAQTTDEIIENSIADEIQDPLFEEDDPEHELERIPDHQYTNYEREELQVREIVNESEREGETDPLPSHQESTYQEESFTYISLLDSARQWLYKHLKNLNYSDRSTRKIITAFNTFVEDPLPFPNHRIDTCIGFSWLQIQNTFPNYGPLADIAMRLHNSALSESSCERTISQQRLIYTSRRRNVNRDLLDARLTIINATTKFFSKK